MSVLLTVAGVLAATDAPIPDPDQVTPGIIGFIVTFGVALVTVLLVVDMVRRVRRVTYREQVRDELEAELAEQNAAKADGMRSEDEPKP